MQKHDILKKIDAKLLEQIMSFCYCRTSNSYEAQDLCSDILFELIKASHRKGEITEFHGFLWRVARNVYADFTENKSKQLSRTYLGNPDEVFSKLQDLPKSSDEEELIKIIHSISKLTKAYREVMIAYYFDGLSVSQIAYLQNTSHTTIRQRLFSARNTIRNEVSEMNHENKEITKPVLFNQIDFELIGSGNVSWGDPRPTCTRQLSKHILWLCLQKPSTATEISKKLNIPMPYVEEELDILTQGTNGEYGLLKHLGNGRYGINCVILDTTTTEKLHNICLKYIPELTDSIIKHIENNKEAYLSFPYLNKEKSLSLIIWQCLDNIIHKFSHMVSCSLKDTLFKTLPDAVQRPFSLFGYVYNGKSYGCGHDGICISNLCGYSFIQAENIYITKIKKHFSCGHNLGNDQELQLAIKAITGLNTKKFTETEKEIAAKAISEGYVYREGNLLYTKILVCKESDLPNLWAINDLIKPSLTDISFKLANELGQTIKETLPSYLLPEYSHAVTIALLPLIDLTSDALIEKGYLTVPKDGIGAEGCFMTVVK